MSVVGGGKQGPGIIGGKRRIGRLIRVMISGSSIMTMLGHPTDTVIVSGAVATIALVLETGQVVWPAPPRPLPLRALSR